MQRVTAIREHWFDDDDPWGPWFRGQSRADWGLSAKLYREYGNHRSIRDNYVEDEIREEFATRAPNLSDTRFEGDSWDWYFLMRHFGAPTRLLDWSEGALIGLYFAVRDNPGYYDAAVWVLDPYELNQRAIGLDWVIPPSEPGLPERDRRRIAGWLPGRFNGRRCRKIQSLSTPRTRCDGLAPSVPVSRSMEQKGLVWTNSREAEAW
jgi:hypothetical protein